MRDIEGAIAGSPVTKQPGHENRNEGGADEKRVQGVDSVSMSMGEGFGFLYVARLLIRLIRGGKSMPTFSGCTPDADALPEREQAANQSDVESGDASGPFSSRR